MSNKINHHYLSLKKKIDFLNFKECDTSPCFADIGNQLNLLDCNYDQQSSLNKLFNSGPWGPWGNNQNNNNSPKNNSPKNSNQKPDDEKNQKSDSEKKSNTENQDKNNSSKSSNSNNSSNQTNKKNIDYFFNNKNQQNNEDFFDKIFQSITNFIANLKAKFNSPKNPDSSKPIIGLVILSILTIYLSTGFYKVNTDENAVILYFGKFHKIATPGLNYYLPFPFGQVIKKSVTTVNTEEFGFSSDSKKSNKRNFDAESLMLTGDENIVDIEFQIQWQIADIKDYVFNIFEPNQAIRKSAESAMREIIARAPIADALSDGKQKIEQDTKILLQEILDSYQSGVRIILVQLRRVDPPVQVIDAFRDVQTAKADKEKEINQAQAYANDIIPRARGLASQMLEQSQAYSKEIVANSEGEAGRFTSIYNQYTKSKQVTKKRLYLETMEHIYKNIDKIYVDKSVAKSAVMPYFPVPNNNNNYSAPIEKNENITKIVNSSQKP